MMKAAIEGLEEGKQEGKETDLYCSYTTNKHFGSYDEKEIGIENVRRSGCSLCKTNESGLDGVVCSTLEVPKLREVCGNEFVTVTPGIRLASDDINDQVRVATPKRARNLAQAIS